MKHLIEYKIFEAFSFSESHPVICSIDTIQDIRDILLPLQDNGFNIIINNYINQETLRPSYTDDINKSKFLNISITKPKLKHDVSLFNMSEVRDTLIFLFDYIDKNQNLKYSMHVRNIGLLKEININEVSDDYEMTFIFIVFFE